MHIMKGQAFAKMSVGGIFHFPNLSRLKELGLVLSFHLKLYSTDSFPFVAVGVDLRKSTIFAFLRDDYMMFSFLKYGGNHKALIAP